MNGDQPSPPRKEWRYANLRGANMRGVNLSGVNFEHADMRACDLRDADCTGAVFSYADLRGSRMQRAIMKDAILTGAQMEGVQAQNVDFTGADMRGCNLGGAALDGARMPQQNMSPISPADLIEGTDHAETHEALKGVVDMPGELSSKLEAAAAAAKVHVKEPPADVGREELGQLPTQDPPRHRHRPKL